MSKETKQEIVTEKEKVKSGDSAETKSSKGTSSKQVENGIAEDETVKKEKEPKKVESDEDEETVEMQKESELPIESDIKANQLTKIDIPEKSASSSIDILPSDSKHKVKFAVRGKEYKLNIYDNRLGTQIKTVAFGAVTAVINKDEPCNKVLVYADPSCSKESILGWANISDLIAL